MLLRNLSHAHIVAYKTSFVDKGELIIIMEFCESKPSFMLSLNNEFLPKFSGRPCISCKKNASEKRALHGVCHHAMVRLALPSSGVHSQKEDLAPWSENAKYLRVPQHNTQTWRFRHLKSSRKHAWPGSHSSGHPILHVSWGVPIEAIQLHVRRLVPWLHSLWALHIATCVFRREFARTRIQDCPRQTRTDPGYVLLRLVNLGQQDARQGR